MPPCVSLCLASRLTPSPPTTLSSLMQKAAADPSIVVEEDWLRPRLEKLVRRANGAVAEQVCTWEHVCVCVCGCD